MCHVDDDDNVTKHIGYLQWAGFICSGIFRLICIWYIEQSIWSRDKRKEYIIQILDACTAQHIPIKSSRKFPCEAMIEIMNNCRHWGCVRWASMLTCTYVIWYVSVIFLFGEIFELKKAHMTQSFTPTSFSLSFSLLYHTHQIDNHAIWKWNRLLLICLFLLKILFMFAFNM